MWATLHPCERVLRFNGAGLLRHVEVSEWAAVLASNLSTLWYVSRPSFVYKFSDSEFPVSMTARANSCGGPSWLGDAPR